MIEPSDESDLLVALDSNVLVRLANQLDPLYSVVERRIADFEAAGLHVCLAAQCLYEFWAVATRPVAVNGLGISADQAEAAVNRFAAAFRLLDDPADLFYRWLYICVRSRTLGKTSHDARLVAWMLFHDIKRLYTLNTADFERFPDIVLVNPEPGTEIR